MKPDRSGYKSQVIWRSWRVRSTSGRVAEAERGSNGGDELTMGTRARRDGQTNEEQAQDRQTDRQTDTTATVTTALRVRTEPLTGLEQKGENLGWQKGRARPSSAPPDWPTARAAGGFTSGLSLAWTSPMYLSTSWNSSPGSPLPLRRACPSLPVPVQRPFPHLPRMTRIPFCILYRGISRRHSRHLAVAFAAPPPPPAREKRQSMHRAPSLQQNRSSHPEGD
ncbi:hypothetical protein BO71DRAFT_178996 [Aspergillus ellipticus CBS 707.79]|uniref:Uncharacterized protein n=1 Tax=Aspergillus ellipticus CBS 707.79 TaxID=1448320 RepID=A0A319DGD9_9EURO|nr:hypothetical protein BO71DRAFT_178996 [Aspergillus ellipticus CBS 707.79]